MAHASEVGSRTSLGLLATAAFFLTPVVAGVAVLLGMVYHDCILAKLNPLPDVKFAFPFGDHEWTSGRPVNDAAITPWKLTVSDEELADLRVRLQGTRYGTPMQGQNFEYGFPGDQLKKVVDNWLTKYDWKKQEALINKYDHFRTVIEGLNIHFVHIRPADNTKQPLRVLPIILFHGWPGSFYEFYKLVPLLTTPRKIGNEQVAFELIIPSLPGFGFSEGAQKPGLGPRHMARIFYKLMSRIKFDKFYIHGGDWGSVVGQAIATMYPYHVLGLELTMFPIPMEVAALKSAIAWITPSWVADIAQPERLIYNTFSTMLRESGHLHIHATKPDTVGAALLNDPAGLAAYILEKFSTCTNVTNVVKPDGGLTEQFTLDDLLTNVMIYWTSRSIMTSIRIYKEVIGNGLDRDGYPVLVPTVLSDFPNELPGVNPPVSFAKPYYKDLIKISQHETGGHFAAMERPVEVAEDIWSLAEVVLTRSR